MKRAAWIWPIDMGGKVRNFKKSEGLKMIDYEEIPPPLREKMPRSLLL